METSGISNRSMNYKVDVFSGSMKMNRNLKAGGESTELSVMLSRFSAKVTTDSFGNFNKQGSLLYENLPVNPESHSTTHTPDQTQPPSLFDEEGYWGIKKTSQRISDFVLQGAGDDLDRLRAGREGMLRGFNDAEKAWGGKLPDISYETMEKSLKAIDDRIQELGGSLVDIST